MRAGLATILVLIALGLLVSGGASARISLVDGSTSAFTDSTKDARGGAASQPVAPAFLVAAAERDIVLLGDPDPTSASFVLGTQGDTAKIGMGFSPRSADTPVYFVVLTGSFLYEGAHGPPGRATPKGTVAILVVPVALGEPIGLGLRSSPVDLAQIGPVGDLLPYLRGELAPACGAADLKAKASFYNGATQSLIGAISLRSRSSQTCALPKTPRVFLTWKGATLAIRRYVFDGPVAYHRAVSILKPNQRALAYLQWSNWCGPDPWADGGFDFGPNVELRLGRRLGAVSAHLPHPHDPGCVRPSLPSRLGVSRFVR